MDQDRVAADAADGGEKVDVIHCRNGGTITVHGGLDALVRLAEQRGYLPREYVPLPPATKRARFKAAIKRLAKRALRRQ